ncbi:bifunctional 5,10-methylenetetrahydrofolate dehydrogenase/5,10-methenyltetrahydrofolate cyclohydrolase [Aerococcus christensenii]|uniref:bifunctional 5,10-methylenetetrahydrofolate dehydrogenase/5,10-methenyltetrahydrofolate cyclohydrolase n=1 Tax=Aerococcus christensenii TaxID=87541 RepID=UPI003F44482C
MKVLRSKEYVVHLKEDLKACVLQLKQRGVYPNVVVLLVGEDAASKAYAKMKGKIADQLGISYQLEEMPATVTTEEMIAKIHALNADENVHGVMVEMPLPKSLNEEEIIQSLDPQKDMDGIHPMNMGYLLKGQGHTLPNTPLAAMALLELGKVDLEGKIALVVGRSNIVGKPLAQLLLEKNATVMMCHSRTPHLEEWTRQADVLCVACGQSRLIKADMVKEGAVVIDIGTNYDDETGKLTGDVDFEKVAEKASLITPVPGGVGPVTTVMIFKQLLDRLEAKEKA